MPIQVHALDLGIAERRREHGSLGEILLRAKGRAGQAAPMLPGTAYAANLVLRAASADRAGCALHVPAHHGDLALAVAAAARPRDQSRPIGADVRLSDPAYASAAAGDHSADRLLWR